MGKIVFANGCFDLLHIGHIRMLREASRLGSTLIVGLNSDSSVETLRGRPPIFPEAFRAEMLRAVRWVDWVEIFDELEPTRLLKEIRPDVLVKGNDWKPEDVRGSEYVGEVAIIGVGYDDHSSDIVERIRNA
jgi:D-beta-D-heptose 7-phosphate kinase/D-beta-D-heptose 1-phosphate adenosyltransferase